MTSQVGGDDPDREIVLFRACVAKWNSTQNLSRDFACIDFPLLTFPLHRFSPGRRTKWGGGVEWEWGWGGGISSPRNRGGAGELNYNVALNCM